MLKKIQQKIKKEIERSLKMAIVRVHHPKLTKEERERREQKIREALVEFYRTVEKEKRKCASKL